MVSEMLFKKGFPGYDQKILAKKTRSCHTVSQRTQRIHQRCLAKEGSWEVRKLGSWGDERKMRPSGWLFTPAARKYKNSWKFVLIRGQKNKKISSAFRGVCLYLTSI